MGNYRRYARDVLSSLPVQDLENEMGARAARGRCRVAYHALANWLSSKSC